MQPVLEKMCAEFGEGVNWKKCVEFTKTNKVFEHKEVGVRDAFKSLIVTLIAANGEVVLGPLQNSDIPDRLLKEFTSTRFLL